MQASTAIAAAANSPFVVHFAGRCTHDVWRELWLIWTDRYWGSGEIGQLSTIHNEIHVSNPPLALGQTMKWVDLAVRPRFSWPDRRVEVPFEGKKVVLQPLTEELSCTASLFDPSGTTFEDGGTMLGRFLSRLAWSKDGGIVELFVAGSNNPDRPGRLGRGNYGTSDWAPVEPWDLLYLPIPATAEANLALALFREGMSINSDPFAFLSYFKILNIAFPNGQAQMNWINNNLSGIWYSPAVDRIRELQSSVADLGDYLYVQGRCAVAHANGTPIVNPDNYADKRRLSHDLPLMKEVAAMFIERELDVPTDSSFWKKYRDSRRMPPELLKRVNTADGEAAYEPFEQDV